MDGVLYAVVKTEERAQWVDMKIKPIIKRYKREFVTFEDTERNGGIQTSFDALEFALAEGYRHVVVLEDDSLPCADFPKIVDLILKKVETHPVYMFHYNLALLQNITGSVPRLIPHSPFYRGVFFGTVAYVMPTSYVQEFVEWYKRADVQRTWNFLISARIKQEDKRDYWRRNLTDYLHWFWAAHKGVRRFSLHPSVVEHVNDLANGGHMRRNVTAKPWTGEGKAASRFRNIDYPSKPVVVRKDPLFNKWAHSERGIARDRAGCIFSPEKLAEMVDWFNFDYQFDDGTKLEGVTAEPGKGTCKIGDL